MPLARLQFVPVFRLFVPCKAPTAPWELQFPHRALFIPDCQLLALDITGQLDHVKTTESSDVHICYLTANQDHTDGEHARRQSRESQQGWEFRWPGVTNASGDVQLRSTALLLLVSPWHS